ncbi:hypothetical protein SLS62_000301 [Diatrype stigma]|uniref:Uncharacterized protein n=1 Tax=Diatrype stigma TaxID=117547 RepID=A0AAN9YSZ5_9PEZI
MGWWDSLWPSSSSAEDPLRKLDPKLREFLEKESPIKYTTTQQPQQQQQQQPKQPPKPQSQTPAQAETTTTTPAVPAASQFQDGRYAHLWKTYRPLAEVEAETKSDHERLMDVLEGYKERRSQIGRAALENCALEQVDWRSCMSNPSMAERMTMCRTQVRKFERCYMMQTVRTLTKCPARPGKQRFLKALGYLSTLDRSPEVEEEIQLHADKLYHQLMEREAEIEQAKAEGRPLPKFSPLLSTATAAATETTPVKKPTTQQQQEPEFELTPDQQETLRNKLEKTPEEDRPAEEAALRGEWRARREVASRVQTLWTQQERERRERKERGEQTTWDRLAGAFSSTSGSGSSGNTASGGGAGEAAGKK